jgi:hypothetical protein
MATSFSKSKRLEFGAVRFQASHRSETEHSLVQYPLSPAHDLSSISRSPNCRGAEVCCVLPGPRIRTLEELVQSTTFGFPEREVF